MFAVLRGIQALTVLAITLSLVCFVEAAPKNGKDKENTGNNNGGNNGHEQYYSSFQAYINK